MSSTFGSGRLGALFTLAMLTATPSLSQSGVWTSTASGDYFNAANWQGGTVAGGAGSTANFNSVDLAGDVSVTVDSPLTLGHLAFGDTNTASGGVWDFFTSNASVLTLDDAAPTITVNQLTPATTFDDVFLGTGLAGTAGFTKLGTGILTIGAPSTALTGPININAGTLRLGPLGTLAGTAGTPNKTMQDGTTIELQAANATLTGVTVAPNATATIRVLGSGSNFLNTIQGSGSGTLNLVYGAAGATVSGEGNWANGGGFATVNMTGLGATPTFFRGRINRPAPNNWNNNFTNTEVNLDNVEFFITTNGGGNNVPFGELNGTASAVLRGGNGGGGSAPRYIVGALNTDSVFAGTINGSGGPTSQGMSLEKVGTGKLTVSGTFLNSPVAANTDIGRQGGVVRVTAGTLALTNTATNIPGGFGTTKSTIDVLAGATFDVSGTNTVYTSSPLQQLQGSGTVVGPYSHVAGADIRPADVSTVDNDTSLTNLPVPTVGTINFNGSLSFAGGTIIPDINLTTGLNDLVQVNGTTSVAGGGVINPNFIGGTPGVGVTYTVLNSTGGFSDSLAGWSVAWPGRGVAPTPFIQGNDLKFTTTAITAGGAVTWTGANSAAWDLQTTQNWLLNGSPNTFFSGDDVTFNDTGANPAVTLTGTVAPRDMTVNSSTNNYSFTGGNINATGALTKQGSSTLTFSGTNQFASASIQGGAVDTAGLTGTLGTGVLTLAGGTILNMGNGGPLSNSSIDVAAATTNTLSVNGTGTATGATAIPALTGSGTLNVVANVNDKWFSLGNTAGFTGELSIAPDGVNATLLGNTRFQGGVTTFAGATVNLTGVTLANQLASAADSITLAFGELNGDVTSTLNAFIGGSTARPDAIWQIGDLGTDSVFDGLIVDAGTADAFSRVVKVGAGKLTLSGANTYTGDTTVSEGILSVSNAYFADLADLYVGSTGVLDLTHGALDVVDSLFLNGVSQSIGTYGAVGSGAQFQVPYITGTGTISVTTFVASAIPGDANGDGSVDLLDLDILGANFGAMGGATLAQGDFNADGNVDLLDLDILGANFGSMAAAAVAVPEPASLATLLVASALGLAAGRRGARA